MSQLLEIQQQLRVIHERIVLLERAMAEHADLPSITANLESAVRIQKKLEEQFVEQAAKLGCDVCRYRAFDELDQVRVGPAFGAIASFQKVVSVVYAALRYGQKKRATIPENVANETSFGFGYAFNGSVEVILTMRNEVLLTGVDTVLDDSIRTIFSIARAAGDKEVLEFAKTLGPGPINAIYQWADENATNRLGAEIEWRKGVEIKERLLVQHQQLRSLKKTIEGTSSESEEEVVVLGTLIAADVSKNRFKFQPEGLPEIRGTVAPGVIDEQHAASLPGVYSAKFRKKTTIRYSTGAEDVNYQLVRLDKPVSG